MIENPLILMGEIGGIDYNYGFFVDKSIKEIRELVPLVITKISSAVTVNISLIEYLIKFLICLSNDVKMQGFLKLC